MEEIIISGIGVSKDVIATIVTEAAEKVDGVVRVGGNDIASNLISVFTAKAVQKDRAVESDIVDGALELTVHLAVFFGYRFTKLAEDVREAIAEAVRMHVGVEVGAVNVCIDSLVFPKE